MAEAEPEQTAGAGDEMIGAIGLARTLMFTEAEAPHCSEPIPPSVAEQVIAGCAPSVLAEK
jgi:hypothetical protein